MGANKDKQNLRFKKISERMNRKVRYDGFTREEISLIKTQKKLEQYEKEISLFWAEAPRKNNGIVDWEIMSEKTLDYFEYITKEKDKLIDKINKLEEMGLNMEKIMNLFMKLNTRSASF
ncbi:hypothetical protein COE51_01165 [Bacillus pseudomycoides]|nr:hypothetical protein COE51_01165 [Bacillus pseudomycoides]